MKTANDTGTNPSNASPAREKGQLRAITAAELMRMDFSNEPVDPHPYGEWRTANGDLVLFNRGYHPLWVKHPDGSVERADPDAWINDIVKSRHFWFDGREDPRRNQKTRRKLDALLRSWGVEL